MTTADVRIVRIHQGLLRSYKLRDFTADPWFWPLAAPVMNTGLTTLSPDRLHVLGQAVRNTARLAAPVAEVGCYGGGSARFIADTLASLGRPPEGIEIHIFDTFAGQVAVDPEKDRAEGVPSEHEVGLFGPNGVNAFNGQIEASARAALSTYPRARFHVGPVERTTHEVDGLRFALVHLDADLYSPTRHSLEFFWPRLLPGGVLVLDDYGFVTCPGTKMATDEFVDAGRPGLQGWYVHTGQYLITKGGAR